MEDVDRAYAAGIIDGEGCISIHQGGYDKYKFRSRGYEFSLYTCVGMASYGIIEWLHYNFGGSISKTKGKDYWRWNVSAQKCTKFLESILPYLKLKYCQAKLGIAFQQQKAQRQRRQQRTEKEIDREVGFFNEMRRLNSGDKAKVIVPQGF